MRRLLASFVVVSFNAHSFWKKIKINSCIDFDPFKCNVRGTFTCNGCKKFVTCLDFAVMRDSILSRNKFVIPSLMIDDNPSKSMTGFLENIANQWEKQTCKKCNNWQLTLADMYWIHLSVVVMDFRSDDDVSWREFSVFKETKRSFRIFMLVTTHLHTIYTYIWT